MIAQSHLPSLAIMGFRGIRSLEIDDLGQVTLLAGKNGIGKTTILEAIQMFASRGNRHTILDLLDDREEFSSGKSAKGDKILFPHCSSLFYGYNPENGDKLPSPIQITTTQRNPRKVSLSLVEAKEERQNEILDSESLYLNDILVSVDKHTRTVPIIPIEYSRRSLLFGPRFPSNPDGWPSSIALQSLGPGLPQNDKVAELWDSIALTSSEEFVINALRLVIGTKLERLAVIGEGYRNRGRQMVAKLSFAPQPVPLKRLGDGAQRLLGIALALANCQNGILLIDEIENGIHYSILRKLWDMIFQAARDGNIQVIAVTHSWDCISSFAHSAIATDQVGTLVLPT